MNTEIDRVSIDVDMFIDDPNGQLVYYEDHKLIVEKLEKRLAAAESRTCEWQEDSDTDNNLWNGECGAVWEFIADGPLENKCNFCPECGGKLVIAECSQQEDSGSEVE